MKIFVLFFTIFLCLSLVIANETNVTYADNTGEVWLESNETIIIEEPICEEQLQILLDEYNNLSKDYHEGASCGTTIYLLKDNNLICGENLKEAREDVGKYRFGFWGFLSILLLIAVIFLYNGLKKNKSEEEK